MQACDEAHPTMMRPDSSSTMMLARPVRLMILPTTVTPKWEQNCICKHSCDMKMLHAALLIKPVNQSESSCLWGNMLHDALH